MAVLSNAVGRPDFWNGLKVQAATFWPGSNLQISETGGGEVIRAEIGVRLWDGEVTLVPSENPGGIEAVLAALEDANRSFFVTPPKRAFPFSDPDGLILGAATPVISSLPAAGNSMAISGLPPGYLLTRGDFLSFQRGSPWRYEFHQVTAEAVANGAGVTPEFSVVPAIRPGVVVGAPVQLIRPYFRAVLLPSSVRQSPIVAGHRGLSAFRFGRHWRGLEP